MSYLPSIVLVALGLILLALLVTYGIRTFIRFRHTLGLVATNTQQRTGLLKARFAATRLAYVQRRGETNTLDS